MEFPEHQDSDAKNNINNFPAEWFATIRKLPIETLIEEMEPVDMESWKTWKRVFPKVLGGFWHYRAMRILTQAVKPKFFQYNSLA